jgi:hypothetical protein
MRVFFAFGVLLAAPALLRAQQPDVRATIEGAPKQLALSGSMRVTLVIEGPKPLQVELPKQLLTADANATWRIRPVGPSSVVPMPDNREQWRQVYRLDPYTDGNPVVVGFNPVTVNGRTVSWPSVEVEVMRQVGDPDKTPPRAPVGVEEPPEFTVCPPRYEPILPCVAGLVGLVCVAIVLWWRFTRRPKPVPPDESARDALAKLLTAPALGPETAEQVAAILRQFVERRFAILATKLTTAELLAMARAAGWTAEQADPLGALLDECDRAKFAGDVPDDDGHRRLVRLATDWINDVGRPVGPG